MRKRAKLTQEQLKSVLLGWKTTLLACCVWDIGEYFSDEHVYTQIEELIEDNTEDSDAITVTREWVEDLGDLFFDSEHSCEEPVDRSTGRKSGSEAWEDIRRAFAEIGVEVVEPETIH